MFYLSEINKDDAALACLVSELDAFQRALYPAESHHCLDLSTVSNKKLRCVIARDANGLPAGCGTLLLQDGNVGEIKRVYIRPEYRGRQLGEQILASLEKFASENSCYQLRLETGIHQQPAIALYRRCGYRLCEAFPPYISDPLSVYMCKDL
ncbi:putative acetyltransferase [Pantoea sp. PNA 14-12]|uniref:GCN5 family acetyltransferase n=1 Tax=Pantoea stewartii TaxID=66269 RepID=A0AB34VH95_9GAMM|nr:MULTISPECIES: GNAT family N-acetyltransferase [Pantoea]KKW50894.1 GCN5 family acetyltransferase [Pantoea ananatis]KGD84564.1 GCN5 family acetyltransferase [Pantoea stewartii subsp. indologenes]KTS74802.1 GCN5 family acetyltransferase [Pantoea stewartii]KTS98055.1 GCN5 family acetyltransferase [Pantoea stewartii]KTT05036.1 GCN5 family acetyltransferase [Pantoea stewartii]